jgi:hypothetical protein
VNRLFGAESTDRTNQQHMVQRWIGMMALIRRDIDPFCESTNNKAILAGLPSTIDWLYPWIHQEIYLYLCESTPSCQYTVAPYAIDWLYLWIQHQTIDSPNNLSL